MIAAEEHGSAAQGAVDRRLLVAERAVVADATVALTLRDPGGRQLPSWEPGAHVDLILGLGADGDPMIRQYSLCGDPDDRERWRIAVLREPHGRGGSALIHERLTESSVVRVRGPRNAFALKPAARYLFLAGGIGITPILPMIREAARRDVPWRAVYAVRARERLAFIDELRQLPDVELHVDAEDGLLDLEGLLSDCDRETAVYACGPSPLLDALSSHHSGAAWSLHIERFTAQPQSSTMNRAFEVVVASTGQALLVAEHETILEVLRREGFPVDWSCREGLCGTCETGVLEGEPDHRDSVLTEQERAAGDSMMICCSRAVSERLVLDL